MLKLYIANKRYSSWSLRPWLFMKQYGVEFEEILLDMGSPDFKNTLAGTLSPGEVPLLTDGNIQIWDSLAIIEYVNDLYLEGAGWPADTVARGVARSVCAEMHSSFYALRSECLHDVSKENFKKDLSEDCLADAARINKIWRYCRENFGHTGPYLFGKFSAADAFYAPVVNRFVSFSLPADDIAEKYIELIRSMPLHIEFIEAGKKEHILADHV